jgi:protein deglycase
MKTGILLYDRFSEYELSVVLSVLTQGNKDKAFIGLDSNSVRGEAGLTCLPETTINQVDLSEIDSLVLPGVDDFKHLVEAEDLFSFVREVADNARVIAAISSAPIILAKAGVLTGHKFTAGVPMEFLTECGFFEAENYIDGPLVKDGNIITARGANFIDFAVALGKKLELDFNPNWYK